MQSEGSQRDYELEYLLELKRKIKRLPQDHKRIIRRLVKKIREKGIGVIKKLIPIEYGFLGEMKVKKPPYRLYVIVNEKDRTIILVEWASKKEQHKLIQKIKGQYKLFK